jgi:hypothetical protein
MQVHVSDINLNIIAVDHSSRSQSQTLEVEIAGCKKDGGERKPESAGNTVRREILNPQRPRDPSKRDREYVKGQCDHRKPWTATNRPVIPRQVQLRPMRLLTGLFPIYCTVFCIGISSKERIHVRHQTRPVRSKAGVPCSSWGLWEGSGPV